MFISCTSTLRMPFRLHGTSLQAHALAFLATRLHRRDDKTFDQAYP
jgi:hypothetical protein